MDKVPLSKLNRARARAGWSCKSLCRHFAPCRRCRRRRLNISPRWHAVVIFETTVTFRTSQS